jgi:hypothetical protein
MPASTCSIIYLFFIKSNKLQVHVFQYNMSLEVKTVPGIVGAVRAWELWLDAALVALMPLQVLKPRVGLATPLAVVTP